MQIAVVADLDDADDGFVGERLRERGGSTYLLNRDDLPAYEDLERPDLVLLLGSRKSAHEPALVHTVIAESRLVRAALFDGVPVMAICYGAQLVARALGGSSHRAPEPELGWQLVDTEDEQLCPPGPWGQLHFDVAVPPASARVLGRSDAGVQCFVDESRRGRVIAWQFHPEVTAETYTRWVGTGDELREFAEPDDLVRQAQVHEADSRARAHALVDAALSYLKVEAPAPA